MYKRVFFWGLTLVSKKELHNIIGYTCILQCHMKMVFFMVTGLRIIMVGVCSGDILLQYYYVFLGDGGW